MKTIQYRMDSDGFTGEGTLSDGSVPPLESAILVTGDLVKKRKYDRRHFPSAIFLDETGNCVSIPGQRAGGSQKTRHWRWSAGECNRLLDRRDSLRVHAFCHV